jgi:ABC-2 type transport system ATP-binding protein
MGEVILKIENGTKKFKNELIFQNVSMEFEKGNSYGFVGPNGCGKSVFFKTLCGYSLLTEGQVIYRGKIIGKEQDFIDDAGIVIEEPEFINSLSGLENLKILAEIQKKISEAEIIEVLKQFDLYEDRNKKVGKYSVGMKQKLRLAQAVMEKPQVLILDEPMNGLDKKSVKKVEDILKAFVENGGTLLMTSHIEQQVEACCKIVYEIDGGEILRVTVWCYNNCNKWR